MKSFGVLDGFKARPCPFSSQITRRCHTQFRPTNRYPSWRVSDAMGQSLKKYGSQWRQVQDLEKKLQHEEGCLAFSEIETDINIVNKHAHNIQSNDFLQFHTKPSHQEQAQSPLHKAVLNKHKITTEGYHSISFVGNHCHKYTSNQMFTQILQKQSSNKHKPLQTIHSSLTKHIQYR